MIWKVKKMHLNTEHMSLYITNYIILKTRTFAKKKNNAHHYAFSKQMILPKEFSAIFSHIQEPIRAIQDLKCVN